METSSARGTAVLLSSHQMNLVEETYDRIFLIHKGVRTLCGAVRSAPRNKSAVRHNDGGKDLILWKGNNTVLVECKKWN